MLAMLFSFFTILMMCKKTRLLLYWLILALLPVSTPAQAPDQFFLQNLDNRNGLSNSAINYIFKDSDNILWIGTWDGLNMYDGSAFHVFNYSKENDFKSIGNNVIQHIAEDKRKNIWVTTIEGISRYEKHSGKFYHYFYQQHQRSRISEQEFELAIDTSGAVFCLTQKQGFTWYDEKADTFYVYTFPRHPSRVKQLAFDEHNRLWLLNNNGELECYARQGREFSRLNIFNAGKGIDNFFITNHRLFCSTTDNQLFEISPHFPSPQPVMQLPNGVTAMTWYNDHYLLAWTGKGFGVYDNRFHAAGFLQTSVQQLQHMKITAWLPGIEQILWYGTDGNGLVKLYPKTKPFSTVTIGDGVEHLYNRPSVRAFCEVNGHLWVGTKGGGIMQMNNFWSDRYSRENHSRFTFPDQLDNNAVYALKKGIDKLIYIGTDGKGIGVYDQQQHTFYKWTAINGSGSYPEFGSVYAILQDADSSVWLGTSSYGLVHLKLRREAGSRLGIDFLERFTFNNDNTGPANDIIYALANGNDQQLWVACRYGGLSLLNKRTRQFRTFKAFTYEGSLSNNDVLSLYHDSKDRIWIGTSYGLNWIDQQAAAAADPVFQKLTTANGLPNNTIHAIEEDASGHIWVSTNKGLAKVQPETQAVSYYQQMDGLQSNEFCDGAVWKDPAGYLFMGGIYGFNYFQPKQIRSTGWRPDLLVTNSVMGGEVPPVNSYTVVKPGSNTPLAFTLERKDGYFELDVKAISFLNAEKCEYAWLLEGYDKAWHQPGTSGKINYSNVPPGDYRLKIKWSDGEGVWTEEASLLNLTVKQYGWLTFPAFLLYGLLLSIIGYTLYRYRKNKQEIRNQLAVEHLMRVREEELHQGQLGFFTNIAHELQTPLTLIMGSAERVMHKDQSPYTSLLHQQASRLTYLVQQLLDFRKAAAGFSNNQYSYLNISELLTNLADPFFSLAEQQQKQFNKQIPPGIMGWADKDKLEKIIFNLLSNAFKHSARNTLIVFSVEEKRAESSLVISVANEGTQLPTEELNRLFDKFYVSPANSARTDQFGTGIGLAFTRQLVTMLGGAIDAQSEEGWITFTLQLPLTTPLQNESPVEQLPPTSGKPSFLYQSVTAYDESALHLSTEENNKRAIIDELQESDRKTILVVEDEPGIRYLLKDILKDHYTIYEAEHGREALELMNKVIPDLIISDVMMPDMDGLELCQRIKNTPATCQIPFIILSAKGNMEQQTEGYEVGADAYIAKPFHVSHLLVRIRKLIEYRQRLTDLFQQNGPLDLKASDMPDADKLFMENLLRVIEENIDNAELNAAFLEKTLAMSRMQLYRKLKTLTNMTPGEFIKQVRLRQAAHLLTATSFTVSEIFYRTGFNNQSYFFREFKKRYQCAPNEYRAQQSTQH